MARGNNNISEAFFTACSEAQPAKQQVVSLYVDVPFYGGPEEGGWWGWGTPNPPRDPLDISPRPIEGTRRPWRGERQDHRCCRRRVRCSAGLDLTPLLVDRHADELTARRRPLLLRWAQL